MKFTAILKSYTTLMNSGLTDEQATGVQLKLLSNIITGQLDQSDPNYSFYNIEHETSLNTEFTEVFFEDGTNDQPEVIIKHDDGLVVSYIKINGTNSNDRRWLKQYSVYKSYDSDTNTLSDPLFTNYSLSIPFLYDDASRDLSDSEIRFSGFNYSNAVGCIIDCLFSNIRVTVPFILAKRSESPYFQSNEDMDTKFVLFSTSGSNITPAILGYAPNINLSSELRDLDLLTSFGVNPETVPVIRDSSTNDVYSILSDTYVTKSINNVPYMKLNGIFKFSNYFNINGTLAEFTNSGRTFLSLDNMVHPGIALEITDDIAP